MMQYQSFEQLATRDLLTLALHEAESAPLDDLLQHYSSPHDLSIVTVEEIQHVTGLGQEKSLQLKAILELARRYATYRTPKPDCIRSAADVVALLAPEMADLDREVFKVLLLDTKHHLLHLDTVAIGGLSSCPAHPREVFKEAIKRSAAALVLVHNHPSGDTEPSSDDTALTKRLTQAGDIIGIHVIDHIIIGRYGYVSFREGNLI